MSIVQTENQRKTLATDLLIRHLETISSDEQQSIKTRGLAVDALETIQLDQWLEADEIMHTLCYWNAHTPSHVRNSLRDLARLRTCWKRVHAVDSA